MFDWLIRNEQWLRWSLAVVLLFVLLQVMPVKPGFVMPTKRFDETKRLIWYGVQLIVLVCTVLLPLNIWRLTGRNIVVDKNLHIQVLFDVSLSMTADDIEPTRFDAAKDSLIAMVKELEWYSMSVIFFSGKPFVGVPFTTQTQAVVANLEQMTMNDFPPTIDFVGTAIGDAMILGVNNLVYQARAKDYKPGVIVLITDGDATVGEDPINVLPLVNKAGVPIFTIAIGQEDFVVGKDKAGGDVYGKINLELLQTLASQTQGTYYRVLRPADMRIVFDDIKDIVRSQETKVVQDEYEYINSWLYVILGIFLSIMVGIRTLALARARSDS